MQATIVWFPEDTCTTFQVAKTHVRMIKSINQNYHLYMFMKIKDATKEFQYSTKIKYILLIHFHEELVFGIQQSHGDQKKATT